MQGRGLETSILKQSESAGTGAQQFDSAVDELSGEIGETQQAIDFAGQLNQNVGSPAVEFGLVQVVSDLEDDGNLRGKGAGAASILAGDAGVVEAIEDAEHSEQLALGT